MTDAAVELMFSNKENFQLGLDIGVAIGPLGRALEADVGTGAGKFAPIYTYSLSKGLYAGISVDGKIVKVRPEPREERCDRILCSECFGWIIRLDID